MPNNCATRNGSTAIVVEGIPPSVNHYKHRNRKGNYYVTSEAQSFKQRLALACKAQEPVYGERFQVDILVALGPGQKGDVDNFCKLVLDTLAKCGIFRSLKGEELSDSHVTALYVEKFRSEEARTSILITRLTL